jgi:AcrR family transcriptional regulator
MSGLETRDRILDAAEELFAEQGVAATSLRAVTALAGVNLAAVHYHFGPKEALLEAVLERRLGPVNQDRLKRLDALEASARNGPVALEDLLEAFFAPALVAVTQLGVPGRRLARLVARFHASEPEDLRALALEQFREVIERFSAAAVRAVPELPPAEALLRFEYALPILMYATAEPAVDRIGEFVRPPSDPASTLRRAIAFVAAGLRAPAPR